jgi:hypothetical protein
VKKLDQQIKELKINLAVEKKYVKDTRKNVNRLRILHNKYRQQTEKKENQIKKLQTDLDQTNKHFHRD